MRPLGFFFILSVFLLPAQAIAADTGLPEEALIAFEGSDYDKAINIVRRTENFQQSPKFLNFLGRCALHNQLNDSAQYYFDLAYDLKDTDQFTQVQSLLGKIDILIRLEKVGDALALFEEIRSMDDSGELLKMPEVMLRKANIMYYTDFSGTRKALEDIFQIMPDGHPDKYKLHSHYLMVMQIVAADKVDSLIRKTSDYLRQYHPNDEKKFIEIYFFRAYQAYLKGQLYQSLEICDQQILGALEDKDEHWALFLKNQYHRIISFPLISLKEDLRVIDHMESFLRGLPEFYAEDHYMFSTAYLRLARTYYSLGQTTVANAYLDQAIKLDLRSGSIHNYRHGIQNRAIGAFRNGETDKAKKDFLWLVKSHDSKGRNMIDIDVIYTYLSEIHFEKNNYDSALFYNQKAFQTLKNGVFSVDLMTRKYIISKRMGQAEKAQEVASILLKYLRDRSLANDYYSVRFLNYYARDLIDRGDSRQAIQIANRIIEENREIWQQRPKENTNFHKQLVETFFLKGTAFETRYNKDENQINLIDSAYQAYLNGADRLNTIKKEFKSSEDRWKNIEAIEKIYHKTVGTAYLKSKLTGQQNTLASAFLYMESYLSSHLYEEFNRNLAIRQTSVPDTLLLRLNNLRQQSSYLTSQIALLYKKDSLSDIETNRLESFQLALTNNNAHYSQTLKHLEYNYTNYFNIQYKNQLQSLEQTQKMLKAGQLLVEYLVGEEGIYAFFVTADHCELIRLPSIDPEEINHFREILNPRQQHGSEPADVKEYRDIAYGLYQKLIEPGLDNLLKPTVDAIIFIPDGLLNYIPFELLITEPGKDGDSYGKLKYLTRSLNISYAYSSSVLFEQKRMKPDNKYELIAFAPSYKNRMPAAGRYRNDSWNELLFNEKEVENITRYYSGRSVTGAKASEQSFTENYEDYQILHLAMHASVNKEEPQMSRLIFAPSEDSLNDGGLHNFELYNMQINNQLTVLSACNTGSGKLTNGEGVMSLARAFAYAGSKSVLMSHWQVDDRSTGILMEAFYRNLAQGKPKSDALRMAKLDYLQNASPEKQHPFFWGAFVMIGDNDPIPSSAKGRTFYSGAGVAILLLIMIIFIFYRKILR